MRTIKMDNRNHRPCKQAQRLGILLIAVLLAALEAGSGLVAARGTGTQAAVAPQAGIAPQAAVAPILVGTFQVVNAGIGDQTSSLPACDLVAYNNNDGQGSAEVRVLDLSTN